MKDAHIYGHPICESRVEVPTLKVVPAGEGYPEIPPNLAGKNEVVVEWLGHSDQDETIGHFQFRFPLSLGPDDIRWMSHPERFRVAFIGPARMWPNQDQVENIVSSVTYGNRNYPLIYVISSHIGLDDGNNGTTPAAYNLPIAPLITLTYDLITPGFYYDPGVIEQEQQRLCESARR